MTLGLRILALSLAGASGALVLGSGCSSREGSNVEGGGAKSGAAASGGSSHTAGGSSHTTGGSLVLSDGGSLGGPEPGAAGNGNDDCAADFAGTELQPARLAFAFDVSGSMGKLDETYHDPALKWRPVVAATRAFFEDATSAGISASLSFFPAQDDKCDVATYETPDVAMIALPSPSFGEAIADIDPDTTGKWRGGTPTLAVVQGNAAYLRTLVQQEPDAVHALVLVTDGYPNGCDDDEIASVVAAVEKAAENFPTYVIGVKNPPGGPDTVSDLDALALAGGTDSAIFIDTGDPNQTATDLASAISRIRERSVSCGAAIPTNPGGAPFVADRVNVSMVVDGTTSRLGYDQDCQADSAWRYDDVDAPTSIVLCPATCQPVQVTPT
ncbi:MAG TPA: vWA domain-containing protein, partial [Polyangiaceae bacterium]